MVKIENTIRLGCSLIWEYTIREERMVWAQGRQLYKGNGIKATA